MKIPPFRHSWLLALCLLTFLPLHAWAANYVVTDTNDSTTDTGCLRYAISEANANPGSTITFDPTVFAIPQTITLDGSDLDITEPVTITGPAVGVAISGNNVSSVLFIQGAKASPVSLSGLTIEDGTEVGNLGQDEGAGVYVALGDVLEMTNCTITGNNLRVDGLGFGGGICNSHGSVTLTNCAITDNSANLGGGICNNGGSLTLTNCTITGNSAGTGSGGGICSFGTETLTNCIISGNSIDPAYYGYGGGICTNGMNTITNCTITGNSEDGGGISDYEADGGSTFVFTNDIVYGTTIFGSSDTFYVSHSDINQDDLDYNTVYTGNGNIDVDPGFVSDPGAIGSGNYGDLQLQSTSPCIGTGATQADVDAEALGEPVTVPITDITGLIRPTPPSMGAYDYAPDNSVSTTTTVASSLNPSALGQTVTFTATVDQGATAYPASGGTVTFDLDGTQTAEPVGANGQASITTTTLPAGSDSVSAAYSGAGPYEGSNSATVTQSVVALTITGPATAEIGVPTPVTISANLATYTGPILITSSDSAATLPTGPVTLSNGTATFDVTFNTLGDQTVTATDDGTTPDTSITGTSNSIDVVGAPTANSSSEPVSVPFETATPVTLSGSDPQGETLTYNYSQPANGVVTGTGPNVTYTPNAGFNGTDSFTFTVTNTSSLTSASATVTLNVGAGTPSGAAQAVTVKENTSADAITLQGTDPDTNPALALTYAIVSGDGPSNGTLGTLNPTTGAVTYTPDAGYTGTDSFEYTVSNGTNTSAPVAVTITVSPLATPPTANPQTLSNVFLLAPICLSGSDPQGEKLTYQIASNPSHGYILFFDPKLGTLIYLQDFFYFGPDSFTFTVTDTSGLTSAPATVSINPPKPPTASAQSVSVKSGSSTTIHLFACDPQGERVTYQLVNDPQDGTISSFNANTGSLVYTPNSGYTGTDSFTFTATDTSDLTSSPATVSVDVTAKRGRG